MVLVGLVVTRIQSHSTSQFINNSIIWLKYGWYFMFIFRSAWLIWWIIGQQSKKTTKLAQQDNWVGFVIKLSRCILWGWLIVQLTKLIFPDIRYTVGFGELNIYKAWVAPPLYYLTKHDGIIRYSGLFSGPNNFAFRLIAITPLLRSYSVNTLRTNSILPYLSTIKRISLVIFGVINISRVVLVGWMSEIIPNITTNPLVKKHKFVVRVTAWLCIGLLILISYLKRESTTEHFALGLDALHKFFSNPWWYGLGSSGPWVHRNWSLLPENYYLQLALDYGFLGPICFSLFRLLIFQDIKNNQNTKSIQSTQRLFVTGFVGVLIAGAFLHVFEDSMVNYLFFVSRWVVYGIDTAK